jgi:hypothetical protein
LDAYKKSYKLLLSFGDKILFEEFRPYIENKLGEFVGKEKIRMYYASFALIVFSAIEAKAAGGGENG